MPPLAAPGEYDDYVPSAMLTTAPEPRDAVIIPPPTSDAPSGRYEGVLTLFIDEQGQVQNVVGSEPLLPPVMEQAAREAFMGARFVPGEIDGHAVRSKVRVQVVFDDTPIGRP
jgi:hypothetical protein